LYASSSNVSLETTKKYLTDTVLKIIAGKRIVIFHSMCYYGGTDNIISLNYPLGKRSRDFSVATVLLGKTEEELWKNLHPTQRQNITKAKKNNLEVYKSEDINLFASILEETYKRQGKTPPGHKYILHHYAMLRELGFADLIFVSHEKKVLSAALIQKFGEQAYYAFGGSVQNNLNAGHYLHWNIMLEYNKAGITHYILGEVANEVDMKNIKFSKGITEFKTRFGTTNIPSASREYIIRPVRFFMWQKLYSIATRIFKFE
jgi:lipid II:glycine glycyltransferase (peptidoglycan interpeptide bridge formation enzyme)